MLRGISGAFPAVKPAQREGAELPDPLLTKQPLG
jgi:hypothetical protein